MIFKQPGANVIDTVDSDQGAIAAADGVASRRRSRSQIVSDRTQTIRAAVTDVQFTLLLTIVLVVMVIFIFLRNIWATIIPSVTVPLALLGACALMWVLGYTLDNLSLMALTISVGFVVDDAIVVLENITRYIEEGEKPYAAALKGAGEIGFTIGGPGPAITPRQQGEFLFQLLGRPPRFTHVPVALLDVIIGVLSLLGRVAPGLAEKAELARIGRYYATESMLVLNPQTGRYDEAATPSTGTETLFDFYTDIIAGAKAPERGDHAVF